MTKKAFVVTGLGYGDEGKGTVAHWLSCRHKAHTVIRTGGAQALHRVVTSGGKSHVFSQFGSGTLSGSATHLSRDMVIDPHAILGEGEALERESGISGVLDMMTIHEDALVITPFQAIAGRLREMMRGKNRNGSVGIGIGETVLDAEILGDMAVRAKDLASPSLRGKLEAMQEYKWPQFEELAGRMHEVPADIFDRVRVELEELQDPDTVQWAIERFGDLIKKVRIVDTDYAAKKILGADGTVVFEGSQGVLLDRCYGFHPHTTKVRTTPAIALSILRDYGYDGEVQSLGVLRAYQTRHGNGPFVTESPDFTRELPDEMNKDHPWQGSFRVGPLDLLASRYALDASGMMIDGLVVTCLDRVLPRGSWKFCDSYHAPRDPESESLFSFFSERVVGIKAGVYANPADAAARQEAMGRRLRECSPYIRTIDLSNLSREKFIDVCASTIAKSLEVPVVAVSIGETEDDKIEIIKGQ